MLWLAWKHLEMMEGFLRLPPVRSAWMVLSSQDRNSRGSAFFSMVNFLALAAITCCMNSCGLTCAPRTLLPHNEPVAKELLLCSPHRLFLHGLKM